MAPVSDTSRRDRGQLIVIGALAIAVSMVALALILNSAIYTHNLASRGDSGADESVQFIPQAERGAGDIIENVNTEHTGASYADLNTYYESGLADWSETVAHDEASNSRIVSVAPASSPPSADVEGVRIADDDPTGSTFEPAYLSLTDWRVAEDVRLRNYEGVINRTGTATASITDIESLLNDLTGVGAFVVEFVDENGDTWRVALFVDDTTNRVSAMVARPDGTTAICTASGTTVRFDITAGTLGKEPCQAFSFVDQLTGVVDVNYYNGETIEGQYSLVVDRVVASASSEAGPATAPVDVTNKGYQCSGPTYETASAAGSGLPYVAPALYATDVRVSHQTSSAVYEGRVRVAPDEPRERPRTPAVTTFVVTDATGSDGQFTVEWATRDPNGDAVDVTFTITGPDGSATFSRSGSGTETFDVGSDVSTEEYEITLTASDGSNSRTVTEYHLDDGDDSGCPP